MCPAADRSPQRAGTVFAAFLAFAAAVGLPLAALAQGQGGLSPELGERPRVFGDWAAGCDNTLVCRIVSLDPRDGNGGDLRVLIQRGPDLGAQPEITIEVGGPGTDWKPGAYRFALDDAAQGLPFTPDAAPIHIFRQGAVSGLRSILSASSIAIVDARGQETASAQVAGLADALRFIEGKLGLTGTTEAVVDAGALAWTPAPAPAPVIVRPPLSARPPAELPQAVLQEVQSAYGCQRPSPPSQRAVRLHRLDGRSTLALVEPPCGGGAYNTSAFALIVDDDGTARPARLESPLAPDAPNEVVSGAYDPEQQTLVSHQRGRGLGDCGVVQRWAWDGAMFRLVHQSEMPRCAGSFNFIQTWRAAVAHRADSR
jgi:hypothetical protein